MLQRLGFSPDDRTIFGPYEKINDRKYYTEADAKTAAMIRQFAAPVADGMTMICWLAEWASRLTAKMNAPWYLVGGSGIPDPEYPTSIHTYISPTTPVLYNDMDAGVVKVGQALLKDQPNVRFSNFPFEDTARVLAVADEHLNPQGRAGVIDLMGFLYFVDPKALAQMFRDLYDWAPPGTVAPVSAFQYLGAGSGDDAVIKLYADAGITIYPRTMEEMYDLAGPWQPFDGGFRPAEAYFTSETGLTVKHKKWENPYGFAGLLYKPE